MITTHRNSINTFAARKKLPTMHAFRDYVEAESTSYGPDFQDMFRHAADLVDKILREQSWTNSPESVKFNLVINLTTARALGLTIPTEVLDRADEIIR